MVVLESSVVRIFDHGKLIAEIIPEVWLFGNESFRISEPRQEERISDLRIVSIKSNDD